MRQDDEYIVIKLLNSDEEYEIVLFNSDNELLENQKTSSSETVSKFYLKIWLIEKKYSPEL